MSPRARSCGYLCLFVCLQIHGYWVSLFMNCVWKRWKPCKVVPRYTAPSSNVIPPIVETVFPTHEWAFFSSCISNNRSPSITNKSSKSFEIRNTVILGFDCNHFPCQLNRNIEVFILFRCVYSSIHQNFRGAGTRLLKTVTDRPTLVRLIHQWLELNAETWRNDEWSTVSVIYLKLVKIKNSFLNAIIDFELATSY